VRPALAYGGALLSAAIFLALIKLLGLIDRSSRVVEISRSSLRELRDPALDDDATEALMREHTFELARLSAVLVLGMAIALAAPLPLLWVLQRSGIVSIHDVVGASTSWQFILTAVVLFVGKLGLDRRARRGPE